jgi:hypothetical protein
VSNIAMPKKKEAQKKGTERERERERVSLQTSKNNITSHAQETEKR